MPGDAIDEFARLEDEGERLKKAVCASDYEKMFKELIGKHESICKKNEELNKAFVVLEEEYKKLKGQMDIVHLIFGKR